MTSKEYYTESLRTLDRHLTETQTTIRNLIKQHTAPISPDMERLKAGLAGRGYKVQSDLYTGKGFVTCLFPSVSRDTAALYCEMSNWEMCRVAYDLENGLFGICDNKSGSWTTAAALEDLGFPPGTPMWFKPLYSINLTRLMT